MSCLTTGVRSVRAIAFGAPLQARKRCAPANAQRGTGGTGGKDAIKDAVKDLPGVKKTGSGDTDFDGEKFINDLKEKWDKTEDKQSVAIYSVGAITVLWLSSSLVSAINGIPLVPKLMELVGLAYTTWFVYRYLLFKESREELISDIDELKKKISGDA